VPSFTRADWEALRARYRDVLVRRKGAREEHDNATAERLSAEMEQVRDEYFTALPTVEMSCCPFDGQPLRRTFDPHGAEGFWWAIGGSSGRDPRPCEHFRVLRGAVDYSGHTIRETDGPYTVYSGPQAPYVIPRLLGLPGMIAVLSRLPMTSGYTAYPIAYFSERLIAPQELAAGWCQDTYSYRSPQGTSVWRGDDESWDFGLQAWIDAGRLRWCPPGSENLRLVGPPEPCPYLDLPGRRTPVTISSFEYPRKEDPRASLLARLATLAFKGEVEALQTLLEDQAARALSPRELHEPLSAAAAGGHLGVVKWLLEQGADPERPAVEPSAYRADGWYWQTALVKATAGRRRDVVQLLLQMIQDDAIRDHALVAAAGQNDVEIIDDLLRAGARPDSSHTEKHTPLLTAATAGSLEAAAFLLERGAKADFGEAPTEWGEDKFDHMNSGITPLVAAVRTVPVRTGQSLELLDLLLRHGADPDRGSTGYGKTALIEAADLGATAAARLLIERGADVNRVSPTWGTALSVACWAGRVEIVRLLLENGADSKSQHGADGALPWSAWDALEKYRVWDGSVRPALPAIRALLVAADPSRSSDP